MAAKVLTDAGLDPTVVVGTKVPQLGGRNWRKGSSDIFLLEACEYKGSFLHLHPDIVLLTNVDWDHVDAYPTAESYRQAYVSFLQKLPSSGVVISHEEDEAVAQSGESTWINADHLKAPQLSVPGQHMQANAKLVNALAEYLGVEAADSLASFSGTWRRFEKKGEYNGAVIIDDYAHHPKEIVATIASAHEQYPDRRIVCLFQPHMHDRTISLFNDFLQAFHGAHTVLISDVYEARREAVEQEADIAALADGIGETVAHCELVGDTQAAEQYCRTYVQQNDVLLVMGAGDITQVATNLVS